MSIDILKAIPSYPLWSLREGGGSAGGGEKLPIFCSPEKRRVNFEREMGNFLEVRLGLGRGGEINKLQRTMDNKPRTTDNGQQRYLPPNPFRISDFEFRICNAVGGGEI